MYERGRYSLNINFLDINNEVHSLNLEDFKFRSTNSPNEVNSLIIHLSSNVISIKSSYFGVILETSRGCYLCDNVETKRMDNLAVRNVMFSLAGYSKLLFDMIKTVNEESYIIERIPMSAIDSNRFNARFLISAEQMTRMENVRVKDNLYVTRVPELDMLKGVFKISRGFRKFTFYLFDNGAMYFVFSRNQTRLREGPINIGDFVDVVTTVEHFVLKRRDGLLFRLRDNIHLTDDFILTADHLVPIDEEMRLNLRYTRQFRSKRAYR